MTEVKNLFVCSTMTQGPGLWIRRGEAVHQMCQSLFPEGEAGAVLAQNSPLPLIGSIS